MEGIREVTVIGAGTMGHGIAQVMAMSGLDVTMVDVSEEILERGLARIRWSLEKFAEKGRIRSEEVSRTLSHIKTTTSLESAVSTSDAVIEAVVEDVAVKRDVLSRADRHAVKAKLIATNTSSIPINELSRALNRPDRFLGIHFFNPPQLMDLVEVIMGEHTSDEVKELAISLVKRLGKTPVLVKRDIPGFIVNRILTRVFEVACHLVEKGKYTVVQIDSAMKYRAGFPMGVFELADLVGLDVAYNVSKVISERDKRFREISLLKKYVDRSELGVKSGKGFYDYSGSRRVEIPPEAGRDVDVSYVLIPAINEAAWLVDEGYADREDVELAMKLGTNIPKGIFEYARDLRAEDVEKIFSELESELGEGYRPVSYLLRLLGERGPEERKYTEIYIRREPPIAWIFINRPHRLNTLTPRTLDELEEAIKELSNDRDVRVVILAGEGGKSFSAGADIAAFSEILMGEDRVVKATRYSWRFNEVALEIENCPRPVIAAIDGYALGGGLELALACDFRIASERAEVGQPEIKLGLIPGGGGTQRLTRLIGASKAKQVIYFGDRIKARDAEALGIIDRVYPVEGFLERVKEFAMRLAEMPPIALEYAKMAIRAATDSSLLDGLKLESTLFGQLFSTKDLAEGVAAFLSKRKPEFKGT